MKNTTVEEQKKLNDFLRKLIDLQSAGFSSMINSRDDFLDKFLKMGVEFFNVKLGMISKISNGVYTTIAVVNGKEFGLEPGVEFHLDDTLCNRVIYDNKTILYRNLASDEKISAHPAHSELGFQSFVGTPIIVNGNVFGTLSFMDYRILDNEFGEEEKLYVEILAKTIGRFISEISNRKNLSLFLEQSRFGYAFCDMSGKIIEVNEVYENITGYSEEELQKLTYWDLTPVEYETHEEAQLESLKSVGSYGPYRKEYIRKDNSRVPVELTGFYVNSYLGTSGIWSIVEDISAKLAAEDKRFKAETQNKAKIKFLSNISHELRTPLHAVLSYAEIGKERVGLKTDEDIKQYFGEIIYGGNKLLTLVNELLDLSKLSSGKVTFNFMEVDFMEIIEKSIATFKYTAEIKKITITNHSKLDQLMVNVDLTRMTQVIVNLISNAVRYSFENSAIDINCFHNEEQGFVQFEIQSEGTPIPENERELIFNAFEQSSVSSSASGGTGLGLSITREIVIKHNGKIWVEPNGNTSVFKFKLFLQEDK